MTLDWTVGNRVALLENGEAYYPRVFEAIAQARDEVLLETFILFDDKVGRQLQQALLRAAGNGATVNVLVDGWGSPDLGPGLLQPLLDAGVQVRAYEPLRSIFGRRLQVFRRMHRKIVVVDDRVAFVGGINYSIDHLDEFGPMAKQDYAIEIAGPLVAQIRAFCRAALQSPQPRRPLWRWRWRRQGRDRDETGARHESVMAALVTRDNEHHKRDIELQYRAALRRARKRVVIANAYFFPGYRFLQEMRRAARRGVRVDLLVQGEPDMAIVRYAASMLYGHLTRAGVHVYEYCRRPFHGKVAVVDDEWATVGSSNLDPLSLALNLEANVVVRDAEFSCQLRARLDELITQHCHEVKLAPLTPLAAALSRLRSFVVFHFLHRFPAWVEWLPKGAPTIEALQPDRRTGQRHRTPEEPVVHAR